MMSIKHSPASRSRAGSPAIFAFRRQELERWIDEAIALLDVLDGDVDLEDDEREHIETRELEAC